MQIGNPLPQTGNTVQIGGITVPAVLATQLTVSIANASSANFGGVANQTALILTNGSSGDGWITDTGNATFQVGTLLGGGQIAVFDGSFAVRVANNSGSAIVISANAVKSS